MFSRKLVINLLIVFICGTVAISLPVIVQYQQKPSQASTTQPTTAAWVLVCAFVGDTQQEQTDYYLAWQISQKRGNTVIATWEDIYTAISVGNPLTYDTVHLELTPQGLIYRNVNTPEDYQKLYTTGYTSFVTYQGQTCVLTLP